MDPPVRSRRLGRVAVVELHRPQARNAMNTAMLQALVAELGRLAGEDHDEAVDAVVIGGSGRCFSAGADIAEDIPKDAAVARMELFGRLYGLVVGYPLPTVAAISGWCIGGGAEVAAACDLRVGAPSAAIRFPGAVYGVPAGAARLPLLVGLSHAKDLLMTARTVGAEEAHRMGFLNRLVGEEDLIGESASLAAVMASNPGALVQKRALDEAVGLSVRAAAERRGLVRWQSEAEGLMG